MKPATLETPEIELSPARPALGAHDDTDALPQTAPNPVGLNIAGNTVTQATAHLPEDQRNLVRWLHDHARRQRLSWDELANATEIHKSTLYRALTDTYRYPKGNEKSGQRIPLDGVCEKIETYRRKEMRRGTERNPEFCRTEVADKIYWLYERVARNHKMGTIYGDSQIGKTTALKQVTAENNGGRTTYVEMPPASGVQLMLKCIAKALLVPPHKSFDLLLEDVVQALDPSKVLIVDEAQRIFTTYQKSSVMRCADTLRYLHDQSGCGLIICGTNVFRDQVKEGEFKTYLKQLQRRGRSYSLQLPTEPPRGDLDMLAARFGLPRATDEAEHIMLHIAHTDGLGVFVLRLRDAKDLAEKKREPLAWKHFLRAYAITEKVAGNVK